MEDGTSLEFGAKQKLVKEITIDGSKVNVKLSFCNGSIRNFLIPSEKMLMLLAGHGASQKLGDEMSGIKEIDDCVLAVDDLIKRLEADEWTKTRTSNGMAGTSVLIQALIRKTGKDVDVIKAFLSAKTQQEKVALRGNPSVKPFVDEIEAEKLAAKVAKDPSAVIDTDALLGELG